MKNAREMPQMAIRLPVEIKEWLRTEAERNGSSQNSEVVRAVRERKERCDQLQPA